MTRLLPFAVLLLAMPAFAADPPAKLKLTAEQETEFNELWDKSYRSSEALAHFYCRLIQQPDAALEYITGTVKPAMLTEKEAKELVAALGSKDEATWKRAYRDLRLRDVRLAMTLDDAWALADTDELKLRLGHLLMGFGNCEDDAKSIELQSPRKPGGPKVLFRTQKNPHYANGVTDAHQTFDAWMAYQNERPNGCDRRVVVTFAALARIGTKPARNLLRTLADNGHAKAWTTAEALAALDRMNESKPDAIPMTDLWVRPYGEFPQVATISQFLDHPGETVKFLRENLKPTNLTKDDAKKLLAKLFSDDMDDVRAAVREFDRVDLQLVMTINDAWKEAKTATHRCRLIAITQTWHLWPKRVIGDNYDPDERDRNYDYKLVDDKRFDRWEASAMWREEVPLEVRKRKPSPSGGDDFSKTVNQLPRDRWYRENTSIYILDAIGTDDAIAIIKDMATGHPDAGPTKAAKEVLKRRGVK